MHRGRTDNWGLRILRLARNSADSLYASGHRTKIFHLYQAVLYSLAVGEVSSRKDGNGDHMKIDIGIKEDDRAEIAQGLSRLLADTYTLYLKTHGVLDVC